MRKDNSEILTTSKPLVEETNGKTLRRGWTTGACAAAGAKAAAEAPSTNKDAPKAASAAAKSATPIQKGKEDGKK